jgi:hypothetical protein
VTIPTLIEREHSFVLILFRWATNTTVNAVMVCFTTPSFVFP